ncbi:6-bladed beta-propeller [Sedimenticola sp.]|uniref:6-bladed beta-propeller n=1 Tax=Sedimenticola sp. TaxID=1940285 RepID=UPI003D12596B
MVKQRVRHGLWLGLVLLAGCAGVNAPHHYDPFAGVVREQWPVWPTAPEVPRYIFSGQLSGEENFVADRPADGSRGLFAILVGLGQEERVPRILQRPQSGLVDSTGRILVTDVSRQAVYVFDPRQAQLMIWEMATEQRRFIAPIGIAETDNGDYLVTDAELGLVARLDRSGRPRGTLGEGLLTRPTGIARDALSGELFIADTRDGSIKVFDSAGTLLRRIGAPGDGPGELNAPTYIAWHEDRLYVTDTLNSRIQIFDRQGGLQGLIGERGLYIGNFSRPKGITVDLNGYIYVVESYFDHLLIFDPQGQFLMAIGGSGQLPGQFFLPAGVWHDNQDQIYVADMFNGRVQVFQFLGGTP